MNKIMNKIINKDYIVNENEYDITKRLLRACKEGDVKVLKNNLDKINTFKLNEIYKYGNYFNKTDYDYDIEDDKYYGNYYTLLILATCNKQIHIIRILLDYKGINVNECDDYKTNALMYACSFNYLEIVKELIRQDDIDINLKDLYGNTALHGACIDKAYDCVHVLLKCSKIDLFIVNRKGKMAIDIFNNDISSNIRKVLKEHMFKHFEFLPVPNDVLMIIMSWY